jgi:hypothetical protein
MEESKFNLWRACFSFCFVDGFLAPKENEWIESKLSTLAFSDDQLKILTQDLKNPPAIEKILPLIKSPADRGFLVNHIRVLSKLDGDLSPEEKQKIQDLLKIITSQIDMKAMNDIIAQDEKASYHEDEVYKVHNKHSFAEALIMNLMKKINPGDYKMPTDK